VSGIAHLFSCQFSINAFKRPLKTIINFHSDIFLIYAPFDQSYQKLMIIKDHEDFYRDNFINDPVSLGAMFPEPSALCGWWSRHDEREGYARFFKMGLTLDRGDNLS
jgi:hypothetical protein